MTYNQFELLADDMRAVLNNLDDHGGSLDDMDASDSERRAVGALLRYMPILLDQLTDAL